HGARAAATHHAHGVTLELLREIPSLSSHGPDSESILAPFGVRKNGSTPMPWHEPLHAMARHPLRRGMVGSCESKTALRHGVMLSIRWHEADTLEPRPVMPRHDARWP